MIRSLPAVPSAFLPLVLAASLACGSAAAQDSPPDGFLVEIPIHFRIVGADDLCAQRVKVHFRGRAVRERLRAMLAPVLASNARIDLGGDMVEGAPYGTYEMILSAAVTKEIPADLEEKAVDTLMQSLESNLLAPMEQERARASARIAELDQKVSQLEQEYVDLRRRAASTPRSGLDALREMVADLEKERLQAELELRTEEAVQQPLREQIDALRASVANMQKALDDTRGRRDDFGQEIAALSKSLGEKMERDAGEGVRARIEQMTAAMRQLDAQHERMQAEFAPLSHQLEELQAELRRANSTVQRLTPRLRQLDELVRTQKDQILAAEEADAQRDVAEMRAESVRQLLSTLRDRAQDLRMQVETMEPVRVELWK